MASILMDEAKAMALASILGCPVASFPQSYLGLPLSTHKLNLSAFFFIIDKIDRQLAGWRVILSVAGRDILVRSVLRALPLYAMSALLLPSGKIQEIESRCRAFFWAGQEKITGGQCKVAWDIVCAPFSRGGLGFLSLHHFNKCLLLKHLLKIHHHDPTAIPNRLAAAYGWNTNHDLGNSGRLDTAIWKDIAKGLLLLCSITKVNLGSGTSIAFWLDLWVPHHTTTLADQFPALFSHTTKPNASVAKVLSLPLINLALTPRLSYAAECDLTSIRDIVAMFSLNKHVTDRRISRLERKTLSTSLAYGAAWVNTPVDQTAAAESSSGSLSRTGFIQMTDVSEGGVLHLTVAPSAPCLNQ